MSMVFEVEIGNGSQTATSYATVAQWKQENDNMGVAYADSDTKIQSYLNQATVYIDNNYKFKGFPRNNTPTNMQALQWPRIMVNQLGENMKFMAFRQILNNEIPREIIKATIYLANEAKNGSLIVTDTGVKDESIGPLRTSYSRFAGFKRYPFVEQLFRYMITSGTTVMRVN
jgi:hypothetical protein